MTTGYVSEIYATRQGEGPRTGEEQIFLRLAGCPLRCDYCDTPESLTTKGHPQLTVQEVVEQIEAARQKGKTAIDVVSVTGGEPLAQSNFLKELLPELKKKNFRVLLETAGVHPDGLNEVVAWCDFVSMDMKLPSAVGREHWEAHKKFLALAGEKAYIKIVIEENSNEEEFLKAVQIIKNSESKPELILQPVTPLHDSFPVAPDEKVKKFYELAKKSLKEVRIMRQQHKIWGIR